MSALSWNEIKRRALEFSKEWEYDFNEESEAKSFMDGFFNVFGINRRRVASFELRVNKGTNKQGFIDLLWKGVLLIEFKSRGKDLKKAHQQAIDYFPGLKDHELPKYILVCDFENFKLFNLEDNTTSEFNLNELYKHVKLLGFMAGYQSIKIEAEDPVNIAAAELMGKLHDQLKEIGYEGHQLELYLVRLLFCLFADDTTIFEKNAFHSFLLNKTSEDGSDLAGHLSQIFNILNTPTDKRLKNLDEDLKSLPYVNGKLFSEVLAPASFDKKMREVLLKCCSLDWGKISPAIFGSMFQSVMDKKARRNLGAHYTSEANILKLIKPLFLDKLWKEFEGAKSSKSKLLAFQEKLSRLTFLDPACGCGNFLIVSYKELRLLELEVIKIRLREHLKIKQGKEGYATLNISHLTKVDVDQFYGIEYEEFPAQIAQVAMWLMDHQMNMRLSEEFGEYFIKLPLHKSATIVFGNALQTNWQSILPAGKSYSYIIGNPPYVGAMIMNDSQREDMKEILKTEIQGYGVLDYVSCWFFKAAQYCAKQDCQTAFVSTNSICQGEQVPLLWPTIFNKGVEISFAYKTFKWSNEARGNAGVHVVIIGLRKCTSEDKWLFEYDDISKHPVARKVKNINAYLVEGKNLFIYNRSTPMCPVPSMSFGSMPRDGGNLILSEEEKDEIIKSDPTCQQYIKPYVGSQEFINGDKRYCLWLVDINPSDLKRHTAILERVSAVKEFRSKSKAASTRKFALTPAIFCQIAQPTTNYLLVPGVSSERRPYIPIGFMDHNTIANNLVFVIPEASLFHFGVLQSLMHMTWVKYLCGRLESRYRYSKDIVYNNFPWPSEVTAKNLSAVEKAGQNILDIRNDFKNNSLADLYDPNTMPPVLIKAHQALDKAVDTCYKLGNLGSDSKRMEFLFELYEKANNIASLSKSKVRRKKVTV